MATQSEPLVNQAKRTFTSSPGTKYMFPSDEQERARLNFQHRLITRLFEDRLILPPVDLSKDLLILDSGTGTGVWTLDVVDKFPSSVRLHGIDIEPRLWPTLDSGRRDRIQFSIASTTNLPEDWTDKFDLVHQRLFVAALQPQQWDAAIKEIFRVTRPGGWVQLWEFVKFQGHGPVSEQVMELSERLWVSKGMLYDVGLRLPRMLADAGFARVHEEKRGLPMGKWAGQLGIDGRDNGIAIYRAFKTVVLQAGGLGIVNSEAEYDDLIDKVGKEWDEIPAAVHNMHCIYAQKPIRSA